MNAARTQTRELQLVEGRSTNGHRPAFRFLAVTMAAALLGTLALLVLSGPTPPAVPFVVLVVMMLAAENRDRLFADETSISGSIAVAMCSVVALRSAPLLGPFACGALAGLYWPHVHARAWAKVAVNATSIGFSTLSAAVVLRSIPPGPGDEFHLVLALLGPAVIVYWLVNTVLLSLASATLERGRFLATAIELIKSETEMIGFACAGALCGLLFVEVGTWAGALALAAVLVAVDVLVISRPRSGARLRARAAAFGTPVALVVAGVSAFFLGDRVNAFVAAPAGVVAAAAVSFAVTVTRLRMRLGAWTADLAFGVVLSELPFVVVAAAVGALASVGGVIPLVFAAGLATALLVVTIIRRRRRLDARVREQGDEDPLALLLVELALLDRPDSSVAPR